MAAKTSLCSLKHFKGSTLRLCKLPCLAKLIVALPWLLAVAVHVAKNINISRATL